MPYNFNIVFLFSQEYNRGNYLKGIKVVYSSEGGRPGHGHLAAALEKRRYLVKKTLCGF